MLLRDLFEEKIAITSDWLAISVPINLLISARPQGQTNAEGCRIFGDLDQLKSKDTIQKNGRLIPTAKRGKEIKQP